MWWATACVVAAHFATPRAGSVGSTTRWFAVHALVNLAIAATTLPPYTSCVAGSATPFPMRLAVAVHVYHAALYPLSKDDLLHHLLFVPTLGGLGLLLEWGQCLHAILFFGCGAPGAAMYGLLVAQRHGLLLSWDEPRVSVVLYTFLRMPALVVVALFMVVADRSASTLIFAELTASNGLFYGLQFWRRQHRKATERNEVC